MTQTTVVLLSLWALTFVITIVWNSITTNEMTALEIKIADLQTELQDLREKLGL